MVRPGIILLPLLAACCGFADRARAGETVGADAAAFDPANVRLLGTTDKVPTRYAAGEKMVFTFTLNANGQTPPAGAYIAWRRTGDDGQTASGRIPADTMPAAVETALDRPGFVRLQATLTGADGKPLARADGKRVVFEGGAGAATDQLRGTPEPPDFDAFWKRQKTRLAEVPLQATMEKQSTSTARVDVFAVRIDCAGPRPVTGYLCVPVGAAEKSLPARVQYQGYGVRVQRAPENAKDTKAINFYVNAHGMDLNQDEAYYKAFEESIKSNGHRYAFDPVQNADPETCYFNGMALRVMRSLEFLKSLPQWDGRTLVTRGGSQGGMQALWGAALDPAVSRAEPDVPWGCDLSGATAQGRQKGGMPAWTPALDYYDAANHAKRIACPVEVSRAGLGDYTSPPSSVMVMFNQLKGTGRITWIQNGTHGYSPPPEEGGRFTEERAGAAPLTGASPST